MKRRFHLNTNGYGIGARTACGRNCIRTPASVGWAQFKLLDSDEHCQLCAASKQANLNRRHDKAMATDPSF